MSGQSTVCNCCLETVVQNNEFNYPGLSAIAYRIGTHGSFKSFMLKMISKEKSLVKFTTREDDDPSIALIDSWSTVLDVLSFYQERIANEGYIRTAIERRSILELARAIGYELNPGVAAGTYLVFNLETAPESPDSVKIYKGTRTQTIPGQDEKPQTFETIEDIQAYKEWNAIKPKTSQIWKPVFGGKTIYLKSNSTNLNKGDALLIVGDERVKDSGNENWDFRRINSVEIFNSSDPAKAYTKITVERGLGSFTPHVNPAGKNPKVYALRQRASFFGYNAPDWNAMPDSTKFGYLRQKGLFAQYFSDTSLGNLKLSRIDHEINFDWGSGSPDPLMSADNFSVRWKGLIKPLSTGTYTFFTVSDDGVRLWVNNQLIINNWTEHGATENTGIIQLESSRIYDIQVEYFEKGGASVIKLFWSGPDVAKQIIPQIQLSAVTIPSDWPDFNIAYSSSVPQNLDSIYLDLIYPQIIKGSWIVISIPEYQELYKVEEISEESKTNFTLSSRTTKLKLSGENLIEKYSNKLRDAVIYGQSEELEIAEEPIIEAISGNSIILDKVYKGFFENQVLIITGKNFETEDELNEVITLKSAEISGTNSILILTGVLKHKYKRESVTIYANVAKATHGESKTEILGNGDASKIFQKFTLKQKPLTYISAPTSSGSETTLEVKVNDILWEETSSFYNLPKNKRAYITRLADDGTVTVQFGDGVTGSRLPTGTENITADYRFGIGLDGLVKAKQISQLLTRPLGVKSVINPLASDGAADPQKLSEARENAPLTVLTLDRIVSLEDYEDFSRAFAGIGKSKADAISLGENQLVHITIAGVDGKNIESTSEIYKNLLNGINNARHPDVSVVLNNYHLLLFNLDAKVFIEKNYDTSLVLSNVKNIVLDTFSFVERSFGQSVSLSEVVAVMQSIEGVVFIDLEKLYFSSKPSKRNEQLPSNMARIENKIIKPADLLLVNPDGIILTEIVL